MLQPPTKIQKRLQRNTGIVEDLEFKTDLTLPNEKFCKLYCIYNARFHKLPDG